MFTCWQSSSLPVLVALTSVSKTLLHGASGQHLHRALVWDCSFPGYVFLLLLLSCEERSVQTEPKKKMETFCRQPLFNSVLVFLGSRERELWGTGEKDPKPKD